MSYLKKNRLFLLCFGFVLFGHILAISLQNILPFIDLPNHLAVAAIYKYYNNPTNLFSQYYEIGNRLLNPNVFHTFFCNLFPNVELGNKLFYIIYITLVAVFSLLIIERVKGNKWFSILAFLLIYNFSVNYGFVGYTISIPFILLIVYLSLVYFDPDSSANKFYVKFILCMNFVLLFYMHAQQLLLGMLLFASFSLYFNRKKPIKLFYDLCLFIPTVLLFVNWWTKSQGDYNTLAYVVDYYSSSYLASFPLRFAYFFTSHALVGLELYFDYFVVVFLMPFILLGFNRNLRITFFSRLKYEYVVLVIFLVVTFCCYLFLPGKLTRQWAIYHRFSVFVLFAFVYLGSLIITELKVRYVIMPVVLINLILWGNHFVAFNKEVVSFEKVLPSSDDNSKKLGGLFYDVMYKNNFRVYIHFHNYYIIRNKGIANTSITDYRFSVAVTRKVDDNLLPPYRPREYDWLLKDYQGEYDNMDYILVRGVIPTSNRQYLREFEIEKEAGSWALYKKRI